LLEARRQRSSIEEVLGGQRLWVAVAHGAAGFALLAIAGTLIVDGARGLALAWGMDEFVVGATVVALGTTAPELATVLAAKLRGHDEVGLGTVLGSNIFNGLFIIPIAAAIHPIAVGRAETAIALGFGAVAIALTYPGGSGLIGRLRGALLLALYAAYVASLLRGWGAP
jgi:cation:H+ antiporter